MIFTIYGSMPFKVMQFFFLNFRAATQRPSMWSSVARTQTPLSQMPANSSTTTTQMMRILLRENAKRRKPSNHQAMQRLIIIKLCLP